ncbi:hypothetical protein GCM10027062_29760 [Nocardioides hungaricus]
MADCGPKEPLDGDRGRHLGVRDGLLGLGPFLPGDLDVDRRLVGAPLSGQLIRVELEPALPRRLQPSLARPIPTRLCRCRLPHRGSPLP